MIMMHLRAMPVNERLSLMLLIPANILYTVAVWTHTWFELPGVWYGLWWAKFCDFLGDCHIIPAFFTDEPGFYHILQVICLFAWGGLFLSMYMLLSTKMDYKFPRCLKKNRHNFIATICFISVFCMSGGLYLFYYILNDFPNESNKSPEIQASAICASLACGFQFIAGLLLLQV